MRKTLLCLLAIVALVVTSAAIAAERAPTTVTLHKAGLHGRVLSPRHRCEKDRKVNLFKDKPSTDTKVASRTTGDDGRFSFAGVKVQHGDYYARAHGVKRGNVSCLPGRSLLVHIGSK